MSRLGLNLNVTGDAEGGRFIRTRPPVVGRAGEGPDRGSQLREYLEALSAATAKVTPRRPLREAEILANKYSGRDNADVAVKTVESPVDTDTSQESLSELFKLREVDELFLVEDVSKKVEVAAEPDISSRSQATDDISSNKLSLSHNNKFIESKEDGTDTSSTLETSSVHEMSESQSSRKTYTEYSEDFETSSSVQKSHMMKSKSAFTQTSPKTQRSNGDYLFLRNCISVDPEYLAELTSRDPNSVALNEVMKGQLRVLKNVYSAQRNWYLSTLSALEND